MLKRFSAAKKTVQSKSVPKMAVFRTFKRLHINCGHLDPKKGTSLAGTTSFGVFFVKNLFRGVGCSELQEPKKALKSSPQTVRKITYMRSKNP